MQYFLAKTDPETYSITDLQRDGETVWDGVHNPAAILVIKSWKVGDLIFVYHSQGEKKIVGLAKVVGEPYENTADPRRSWVAKVAFARVFNPDEQVSLAEIKAQGLFDDFALVKQSRLSTMACPEEFVRWMRQRVRLSE